MTSNLKSWNQLFELLGVDCVSASAKKVKGFRGWRFPKKFYVSADKSKNFLEILPVP